MKKTLLVSFLLLLALPLWAQQKAILVHQEANLYKIDSLLYRSQQLVAEDKAIVKKLPIKSIINLRYFTRTGDHKLFNASEDIQLINYPLLTWRINAFEIAQTLKLIRKHQQKGAVLIHCYHGADRTGIMVAMYRIIYHHWSIEAAKQEMLNGPYGYHSVWKNLEALFTKNTVNEVRKHLGML
jgi:protein tyrosine/serine phosphatase